MASLRRWVLTLSSVTGIGAFIPFADVEELKPQRLESFCSAADGSRDGLRWCRHAVRKQLDDGGDVELQWRMHVDPGRILSMDTEAAYGARLVSCLPGQLELVLPASHEHHAAKDQFIVASRFAHNCQHLPQRHMYHRVVEVKRHERHLNARHEYEAHVHLSTEEMHSFAHVAKEMHFHFSYMPAEARDLQPFPEMRTDFGAGSSMHYRRLKDFSFDSLRRGLGDSLGNLKSSALEGMHSNGGGFHAGQRTSGGIRTQHDILNLSPKQVSNFGWNWNFAMNATEEPEFNITGPGARGVFKVHEPYIKVHAGIYLNFSSVFTGLTNAPRVRWEAGLHGHGYVQARIMSLLNTTEETEMDPLKTLQAYDLPMLEKLAEPKWFEKIDFSAGGLPISMEPGFQFQAKMYHSGRFKGALAVGGKTHGIVHPSLSYDSVNGFDAHFDGTLLDSDIWPPLWMIFTHRFELGIMFKPTVLMRGDFAGLKNETLSMELRPYLNVTVTRQGEGDAAVASSDMKTLTLYPWRVMGLDNVDLHHKYKVMVTANGQLMETSAEINWGQVYFHDHVSKFNAGRMSQNAVLDQLTTVTLVEIDESNGAAAERTLGSGSVRCTSLQEGECHPTASIAHILSSTGAEVAAVELTIIWDDDPARHIASKLHGVSASFPEVVMPVLPPEPCEPLTLHLHHGGTSYVTRLVPTENHDNDGPSSFRGETTFEFAPTFPESWKACPPTAGSKCESPRLALYCGASNLASGTIPDIEWTSATAMQGTTGSLLTPSGDSVTVSLRKPGDTTETFATAKMNANIVSSPSSSFFLSPRSADQVGLGSSRPLIWTVSNVHSDQEYVFTLSAMKLDTSAEALGSAWHVSNKALNPIFGSVQTFTTRCHSRALGALAAGDAPCTFEYDFLFSESHYAPGDQVALLVRWSDGNMDHAALSPPFEVVPPAYNSTRPVIEGRRLWSAAGWNARVAEHQESCDEKDLHFNLGAGLLMRGKVHGSGMNGLPELSTGFKSIAAIAPGTDAQELLPDLLCKDGLCQGALPGCTEAGYAKKHYPTLVFSYNRPFRFNEENQDQFTGILRQALAYGFSALPEVVDVVIREVNETLREKEHAKAAAALGAVLGGSSASQAKLATAARENIKSMLQPRAPVQAMAAGLPAAAPMLAQALDPPTSTTTAGPPSAFSRWWGGARRLQGLGSLPRKKGDAGHSASSDEAAGPHQVTLTFREGLPFKVDRLLVEKMLRHGYFMDIEDDASDEKGPLHITDFYLDEGPVSMTAANDTLDQDASLFSGRRGALTFSAVAVALGIGMAVFLVAKRQAQQPHPGAVKVRSSDSDAAE